MSTVGIISSVSHIVARTLEADEKKIVCVDGE